MGLLDKYFLLSTHNELIVKWKWLTISFKNRFRAQEIIDFNQIFSKSISNKKLKPLLNESIITEITDH
jgi:hypothetical protein